MFHKNKYDNEELIKKDNKIKKDKTITIKKLLARYKIYKL